MPFGTKLCDCRGGGRPERGQLRVMGACGFPPDHAKIAHAVRQSDCLLLDCRLFLTGSLACSLERTFDLHPVAESTPSPLEKRVDRALHTRVALSSILFNNSAEFLNHYDSLGLN